MAASITKWSSCRLRTLKLSARARLPATPRSRRRAASAKRPRPVVKGCTPAHIAQAPRWWSSNRRHPARFPPRQVHLRGKYPPPDRCLPPAFLGAMSGAPLPHVKRSGSVARLLPDEDSDFVLHTPRQERFSGRGHSARAAAGGTSRDQEDAVGSVSYTHLRAHETRHDLV